MAKNKTHPKNLLKERQDTPDADNVFGNNVKDEIRYATKALNDFADGFTKVKMHKEEILQQLNSCTKFGETARIMGEVRRKYM